ncbi:uncharacterized protein wu:fj19g03 [Pimephales promelas]|uniref:uncharacterized protein wu:fj19g03 n=1 Tax=Pimephales promelas TaxID=90988 RepID=UPI001955E5DE|nr:uncharacterized protein wu:fj19g03 [Pimephales promelas]KAG1955979.1 hypothetical protein F2P79_007893 [Pimephales promelas]
MLAALALVLLVCSATEGRILKKCELKAQLKAAQIQVIQAVGDKTTVDKFITTVVCNVENISGFNTSLVTRVLIKQDKIRPPVQIPPKPKVLKIPAKVYIDTKLKKEYIIPVKPQSLPKGRPGRSVPKGKTVVILGAKDLHHDLFPGKVRVDSTFVEESSGDSSEEERKDVVAWSLLGVFQLNDHVACNSGLSGSLNLCGLKCSALVDDDITDDIACLKTLARSRGKFIGVDPKNRFLPKLLAKELVKECHSVVSSKYFPKCA